MMSNESTPIDDDMHFVMRWLFFEYDTVPMSTSLLNSSATTPLPNIALVMYQNLVHFISKLAKILKL